MFLNRICAHASDNQNKCFQMSLTCVALVICAGIENAICKIAVVILGICMFQSTYIARFRENIVLL